MAIERSWNGFKWRVRSGKGFIAVIKLHLTKLYKSKMPRKWAWTKKMWELKYTHTKYKTKGHYFNNRSFKTQPLWTSTVGFI